MMYKKPATKKAPMKKASAKKPAGKKPAMVTAKATKGTTAASPMKGGFSKMMKSTGLDKSNV